MPKLPVVSAKQPHSGDIGKYLLRKILNQIKISPEELRKLIEK